MFKIQYTSIKYQYNSKNIGQNIFTFKSARPAVFS